MRRKGEKKRARKKILVEWREEKEEGKNSLSATFYDFLLIFFSLIQEKAKKDGGK
jgi:hypothetical protein